VALSAERRETRRRHLVTVAQALIREKGDAGFAMTELAVRAGVSPATPYNLVGSKADLLRLLVNDEFASFSQKLQTVQCDSPLRNLLDATALVVAHYEADRQFYQGLFRSAFSVDATEVRDLMTVEGQALWQGLVRAAIDRGEIISGAHAGPLTAVLLRTIGANAQAWLAEGWNRDRFALEMASSVRLVLAAVAAAPHQAAMIEELVAAQGALSMGAVARS
jgi:AcrR family transcriptional regulator